MRSVTILAMTAPGDDDPCVPNPNRPESASIQIADVLKHRIARGDYPPHTRLPPVDALTAEFKKYGRGTVKYSRGAVTAALGILKAEGWIDSKPGVSMWVLPDHPPITES